VCGFGSVIVADKHTHKQIYEPIRFLFLDEETRLNRTHASLFVLIDRTMR